MIQETEINSNKFLLGDLGDYFVIERETTSRGFWIVSIKGKIIDQDKYSNDIRARFEHGDYNKYIIENHKCSFTQDISDSANCAWDGNFTEHGYPVRICKFYPCYKLRVK
jgi:hypothetical protein